MKRLLAVATVALLTACGNGDDSASVEDAWWEMWAELDDADQNNICGGLAVFGPELAGQQVSSSSDGRISPEKATEMLQESCLDV